MGKNDSKNLQRPLRIVTCRRGEPRAQWDTITFHPASKICRGKKDHQAEPGKTQMRRRDTFYYSRRVNPTVNLRRGAASVSL